MVRSGYPNLLRTMDDAMSELHGTLKFGSAYQDALSEKPSFYFHRNCFIATQMTAHEIGQRHQIGVENIIWGNDFPHPEGTGPIRGTGFASATTTCRKPRHARFWV